MPGRIEDIGDGWLTIQLVQRDEELLLVTFVATPLDENDEPLFSTMPIILN